MTDFIIKYTHKSEAKSEAPEEQPSEEETGRATWTKYVDGSSTSSLVGGGIILVTPKGNELGYAIMKQCSQDYALPMP